MKYVQINGGTQLTPESWEELQELEALYAVQDPASKNEATDFVMDSFRRQFPKPTAEGGQTPISSE